MPEFTLRDPDGAIHVVGNVSDQVRLLARGYKDITGETPEQAPADPAKPADRPKARPGSAPEVSNDSK